MNGDNMTVKEIAEHIISQRDLRYETPNIVRLAEAFLQLSHKNSPREAIQSTIDWWEDTDQQDVAASLGIKTEQLSQWAIVNEMIENFLSQDRTKHETAKNPAKYSEMLARMGRQSEMTK